MQLFSRRKALSTSASFQGIGAGLTPPAAESDDEMNKGKEGKKTGKDSEKKDEDTTTEVAASTSDDDNDDEPDDDDEDGDDDTDEDEMKGKKGKRAKAARMRERARIAHIMSHPSAAEMPDFALKMALTSDFGRDRVCAMLDALPKPAASNTLHARMKEQANKHVGPAAPAASAQEKVDQSWDAAIAKVTKPFGA